MNITISLNMFERNFLLMLSERGGNQDMDENGLSIPARLELENLKNKGAIDIVPIVGSCMNNYKLTSIGINLVDMIKET